MSAGLEPAICSASLLDVDLLPVLGKPLVVAVSGGADSLALWDLLALAGYGPLVIWHLDHGIRSAGQDVAVIQALALRHRQEGLPVAEILDEKTDIPAQAKDWGMGFEEAGRRFRYARLAAVAEQAGAEAIITGHHRDDQAETVLMNLLRGAADTGLMGMVGRRTLSLASGRCCVLVRPLLHTPRIGLRDHLKQRGIAWSEDPTNQDQQWRRNQMRHGVLPTLESGVPGFTEALLAQAHAAQERWAVAEIAVEGAWQSEVPRSVRLAPLIRLPDYHRHHAWRRLLVLLAVHPDRQRIARIEDLVQGEPGRRYRIGAWMVRRRGRALDWIPAISS